MNKIFDLKLTILSLYLLQSTLALTPQVYYGNIGESVRLQCTTGGGQYVCFSTYTFQNAYHSMVMLNNSLKYQVTSGSVTISNLQATDAGFYACSSNCDQMRSDQISYFLQPMCKYIFSIKLLSFLSIQFKFTKLFKLWVNLLIPARHLCQYHHYQIQVTQLLAIKCM